MVKQWKVSLFDVVILLGLFAIGAVGAPWYLTGLYMAFRITLATLNSAIGKS